MRKMSTGTFGIILTLLILGLSASADPIFTGDVPADFTAEDVVIVPDRADVGTLPGLTELSGWDMADVYFDYDHATDVLYVGVDCFGICGDADGDGDPGGTSVLLGSAGGEDFADFGESESFAFLIDTDMTGEYEVIMGVPDDYNIYGVTISGYNGDARYPDGFDFDAMLTDTHTIDIYASPNTAAPDLEFSVTSFSTLPGFSFTPGITFAFRVEVFLGSFQDAGIGEDFLGPLTVTIPGLASLGDYVWYDMDIDGIQDAGEWGIEGVSVELYDGADNWLESTTTDASGYYIFTRLMPGDYSVRFIPPDDHVFSPQNQGSNDATDSDADTNNGQSHSVTLGFGQHDPTLDAGLYQLASLGDYVWHDVNANGIQGAGEIGIADVTVELYAGAGNLRGSTTTDASGLYSFTNLIPGNYFVRFIAPGGYAFSPPNKGGNDAIDSDARPGNDGTTSTTYLSPGEHDPTLDAGLYRPASLGDYVWYDVNADGFQDADESGVADVTVELYDGVGKLLDSTATDDNGYYIFTDLTPGNYLVKFITPSGYVISLQNQGSDDAQDSDACQTGWTSVISLISGQHDPTWDAGLYQYASLGDYVWHDLNADGIQDAGSVGIANVTVELYDGAGNRLESATTNASGFYGFYGLLPGDYRVRFTAPDGYFISPPNQGSNDALDSDADQAGWTNLTTLDSGEHDPTLDAGLYQLASLGDYVWLDLSIDGIQDASEIGIANVSVQLYDGAGNLLASTATDASGGYGFFDLIPGDYLVEFTAPDGYGFSPPDEGANDAADSDANPSTGRTIVTTLDSGEHDPTWDAGLHQIASLGDYVWHDLNADGIQDEGEIGIAGVSVQLYNGAGDHLASAATDADGFYLFSGLLPGDYWVEFTAPQGYNFSPRDEGEDDGADSDANRISGRTVVTTLGSGEHDPTWDAGLYQTASLGDYVWHDLNADGLQDEGEIGIAEVSVELYDGAGQRLDSTTTDDSGSYAFTNLTPGDYSVRFTAPGDYLFSPPDTGADDAADSDADPVTGQAIVTPLESGEHDPTWDAGLYLASPAIALDKTVNVITVNYDAPIITYTIRVTNVGNILLNPVTVTDTLPDGVTYVPDSANPLLSSVNGQLLTWDDVTAGTGLLPGQGTQITFQALVARTMGDYVNVAFCEGVYADGVVTDTDDALVIVQAPEVALSKHVTAINKVDRVITFTIVITNTGSSTIDVLPLVDYFTSDLLYKSGIPPADFVDNDAGMIKWDDLTAYWGNMAPGDVFVVTTAFWIAADVQNFTALNQAATFHPVDVYRNPVQDVEDTVVVIEIPTAIDLLYLDAAWQDNNVRLAWATATEINNYGFRVMRSTTGQLSDAVAIAFIPGQGPGTASGASYTFDDENVVPRQNYTYWLATINWTGQETLHGPLTIYGSDSIGNQAANTVFLPLLFRQAPRLPQHAVTNENSHPNSLGQIIQWFVARARLAQIESDRE